MGGRGFFDSHISHFHNKKTTQKSQLFYKTPTKPLHQNSSATAEDCYNPKQNPLNLLYLSLLLLIQLHTAQMLGPQSRKEAKSEERTKNIEKLHVKGVKLRAPICRHRQR